MVEMVHLMLRVNFSRKFAQQTFTIRQRQTFEIRVQADV